VADELRIHNEALARRPVLLAFNKIDMPEGAAAAATLLQRHPDALAISAAARTGVHELLHRASELASRREPEATPAQPEGHRTYRMPGRAAPVQVAREDGAFRVHAPDVERLVAMTDLSSDEAVTLLQRRLKERGVDDALAAAGAADGDDVVIGEYAFTYVDER
jgi:GTP-binding protein